MKRTFIALILLCTAYSVMAQRTNFGIKGGINVANLRYDDAGDPDSKIGFHAGLLAHIHVNNRFAVQPELVYSQQGAEYGDDDNGGYEIDLNYLNVPVMLQYMAGSGFRLQTGPQLGFLLGAEAENDDVEFDIEDSFDDVDFSWSFGAGYLFNSGLGIDARYNLGISNINDGPGTDVRNGVFQAGLFYQFRR